MKEEGVSTNWVWRDVVRHGRVHQLGLEGPTNVERSRKAAPVGESFAGSGGDRRSWG